MKELIIFLLFAVLLGCKPEINNEILVNKYSEGYNRIKYSIATNRKANKDQSLLPLIDIIIQQTKTQIISKELRRTIVDQIVSMPKPRFATELHRFNELKSRIDDFAHDQNSFLEDLDFMDRFLIEKYWQYNACGLGSH